MITRLSGVLLGLGLAGLVLLCSGPGGRSTPPIGACAGPALSDCEGDIRELVIQYVPDAGPVVQTALRAFLADLPDSVIVTVVCPDRAAYDDFISRIGSPSCVIRPVLADHQMTFWSRDRWLALSPIRPGQPTTLLLPHGESGAEIWAGRAGDRRVGLDIAAASDGDVRAERDALYFDGGDFVADEHSVFVTPRVFRRNFQRTVAGVEQLVAMLTGTLKRNVVLLENAPEHHAGMFMMTVGSRTVIVGDPALAKRHLERAGPGEAASLETLMAPGRGFDSTGETQLLFDAVAEQCRRSGYHVMRIPVLPGRDGRTYLTYLNVIIDCRDGERVVYMPVFRGAESLNRAAEEVWRAAGYTVRQVDCTDVYVHGGSLRCLVSVLGRG